MSVVAFSRSDIFGLLLSWFVLAWVARLLAKAARRAKVANSEQAAGGSAPEPTALADFARFVERVAGVDLSSNPKTTLQRLRLQAQALLVAHGDNSGAANVPPAAGETATVGASAPAAQAPSTQWTTAAIVAEVQKLATSLLREKGTSQVIGMRAASCFELII